MMGLKNVACSSGSACTRFVSFFFFFKIKSNKNNNKQTKKKQT